MPARTFSHTLHLEPLESQCFQGRSPAVGWKRIFGGLVLAQALEAANRTVDAVADATLASMAPHSLHAYFLLAGNPDLPIHYAVEVLRNGRSFATRRVVARQEGTPIFALSASYHREEVGYSHQAPMPSVPSPESLLSDRQLAEQYGSIMPEHIRAYLLRDRPVEMRMVAPEKLLSRVAKRARPDGGMLTAVGTQAVWFRPTSPVAGSTAHKRAVLAYISDMTLLDTALAPHELSVFNRGIQAASLDHAMWFHADPDFSDWILYVQDGPAASGARGLARGFFYRRSGLLLATVAQEGLIRPVEQD